MVIVKDRVYPNPKPNLPFNMIFAFSYFSTFGKGGNLAKRQVRVSVRLEFTLTPTVFSYFFAF